MSIDPETGVVVETLTPAMPPAIAAAVVQVMKSVRQIGYDKRNQHAGYNYVGFDKFAEFVRPIMADAGLFLVIQESGVEIVQPDKTKPGWLHVRFQISLVHESGAMWGPLSRYVIVVASGAQAFASAQSYIQRYFLRSLFMVPTGDKDADDPDATEAKPLPEAKATAPAAAPPLDRDAAARVAYADTVKAIKAAATVSELDDIGKRSASAFEAVKAVNSAGHDRLQAIYAARLDELSKAGKL